MKLRIKSFLLLGLFSILPACASQKNLSVPFALATFTENDVEVSIQLDSTIKGDYFLAATFTPLNEFHMYSKDIPLTGVDGLGRPTLLELPAESQMIATGELIESVPAEMPDFEPKELLVYPPGAVTLSLPVQLPPGNDWVNDTIKITYMSCSDNGCKAPVVGKLVAVRIPGADNFTDE